LFFHRFASHGAKVIIAERDEELGHATVQLITANGGNAAFVKTDTSAEQSVIDCMKFAFERYGSIRILVNNAAAFVFGHLKGDNRGSKTGTDREIRMEDWERVFKTNVIGYANCIKHVVPYMLRNEVSGLF
jgi:NAD(P)-dependent dehydrogenase (short-subunit alcohol dehydrogenase family)